MRAQAGPKKQGNLFSYTGFASASAPVSVSGTKLALMKPAPAKSVSAPNPAPATGAAVSKLEVCGMLVWDKLKLAAAARHDYKPKLADTLLKEAMALRPSGKAATSNTLEQRARRTAQCLEQELFAKSGDGATAVHTITQLLGRPAVRELMRTELWFDRILDLRESYMDGEREAIVQLPDNVRGFVAALSRERGGTLDTKASARVQNWLHGRNSLSVLLCRRPRGQCDDE